MNAEVGGGKTPSTEKQGGASEREIPLLSSCVHTSPSARAPLFSVELLWS